MNKQLMTLVYAFLALLHTDSDDKDQIAQLKGQVGDLQSQLNLSDQDKADLQSALNQAAAATPPTATDTATVAAVAPATGQSASAIPAPTASVPTDVAQAAAAAPAATAADPNAAGGNSAT